MTEYELRMLRIEETKLKLLEKIAQLFNDIAAQSVQGTQGTQGTSPE